MSNKILIGVSSCLMGEEVRFDSGHKRNTFITNTLTAFFEFRPFCPEVSIGLGIPRQTIRLVLEEDKIKCVGNKDPDLDVTEALLQSADDQRDWHQDLAGYILKKDSPSCGMERVRVYHDKMPTRDGVGLYAKRLMENFPHLPIEEEGRLGDAVLRENFIQRVFVYHRWRELCQSGMTQGKLTAFHAQHKYIFMSHSQDLAKELGAWVAESHKLESDEVVDSYLEKMMTLLKVRASKKSHANTLAHIQGYLKKTLDGKDKQEMVKAISDYKEGLLPLIVPVTLLRHHFMHHPNDYITESYYLKPHPSELMLLNSL